MKLGTKVRIKENVPYANNLKGLRGTVVGQHPYYGDRPNWLDVRVHDMPKDVERWYGGNVLMFRPRELEEPTTTMRVRIKNNVYGRFVGQIGTIVSTATWGVRVKIDGKILYFSDKEFVILNDEPMNILYNYAVACGLNATRRLDGSFYITLRGRDAYSVIYDRFSDNTFETWNYMHGANGIHYGRHIESVKRSLRRLRARG